MFRSFLSSLILHLIVLVAGIRLVPQKEKQATRSEKKEKEITWIEVTPMPSRTHSRVAQTELEEKTAIPKEDAYLGQQNQVVKRQTTRSQDSSQNQNPSPSRVAQKKVSPSDSLGIGKKSLTQNSPSLKDLGLPILPGISGAGGRKEYLPLPEGAETTLNTREFQFYSYYQRIREQLERSWTPLLREKLAHLYRSGRTIAAERDHMTRLMVVLNKQGEITRVQVIEESGTKTLDESAVEAFNRAGPFPNPPQGMIEASEEVQIPWDFVLKT